LVICVTKEIRKFGTCDFKSGATRSRIQQKLRIKIYEAATGTLLKEILLEGSEPRQCPPFQLLSNSSTIYGRKITKNEVRKILDNYFQ